MSSLSSHELTHPELLSDNQLRELLNNSCIDTLNLKNLCKNELLEMYRRISMPLPQRQRGSVKTLNAEVDMISEESLTVVKDNNMHSLNASLSEGTKRILQSSQLEEDKLKPVLNDQKSPPKKIRLSSTPKVETTCNVIDKRKWDGQNQLILFLGLAAIARGAVVPAVSAAVAAVPLARLEEFDAVPQYSFAYDVQDAVTGDSKAQYETRNGDIVQGSYSLIEADGTRRIVEYTADPINGFNAVVSREPATAAVAAVAASPLLPLRPALPPVVAGVAPAAPVPSIPALGPDSDVEVVEARSGPLTREQEIQRQQQREQLRQLQRLQDQQQEQQLRQLQRLQEQQRQQSSKLQVQQQQQQQQLLQQRQQQRRPQAEEAEQQQEQQQQQERQQTPARAVIGQVQPAASGRLVGLPATAKAIASYPAYPYAAYTAAYTSPLAYATPIAGLTYAPAPTLA
ncbi:PH domain-containing protein DDB_G0275795-like isoform X2 [Odontomachus brunneus]|uniref:PH domain-containing protein DDB_G0275795-like isoform X2 n=1 Tax=Odontomachus brunneus TaxID=486640 RepID=UPI0013F22B12|nr:PH domain-containing protein DDB_G0275795-like isoform X2 [Odontomachus brunneus]